MNEHCDPKHIRLPAFYARYEKAITAIDPDYILWLEGNTFTAEWKGFEDVQPNCVYALHGYSTMGFSTGRPYEGTNERKEKLQRQFLRNSECQRTENTPTWNGEFEPVFVNPKWDENVDEVNQKPYNMLGEQLRIYGKFQTRGVFGCGKMLACNAWSIPPPIQPATS